MKKINADWVSDFDDKPHPVQNHLHWIHWKKKIKISKAVLITHFYASWLGNTECHLFKFISFCAKIWKQTYFGQLYTKLKKNTTTALKENSP